MTGSEDPPSEHGEAAEITRRGLLGVAGLSGLSLLAGCGSVTGSASSGIDVYQNGSPVTDNISKIDFSGLTTVEETDAETVAVNTALQGDDLSGIDTTLGAVTADSVHVDTNQPLTFGDNNEVTATFDQDTQRLMLYGSVETADGDFKGPYDTNNYVHDMILPGMHAHATDAVGAQDNVLGYADEWATVSHTPLSDGAGISAIFKPGPSLWAGWKQGDDYPATITIEDLEEDWGPGRAMVMFKDDAKPRQISVETKTPDGGWEQVATETDNADAVVILDVTSASTPVNAIRWTFADPRDGSKIHISNIFYFSMSVKGNTWLPKSRGETTDITFLPRTTPEPPEEGVKLFADTSGELKTVDANGTEQPASIDPTAHEQSGTVTLNDGSATVATGVCEAGTHLSVHLDPTGGGTNDCCVSVTSSVQWDSNDEEYKLHISEDETAVGDPDIGYKISKR